MKKIILGRKNYVIFGAGSFGEFFFHKFKDKDSILFFVDNREHFESEYFCEKKIFTYNRELILNNSIDYIVICSEPALESILKQLINDGIDLKKILIARKETSLCLYSISNIEKDSLSLTETDGYKSIFINNESREERYLFKLNQLDQLTSSVNELKYSSSIMWRNIIKSSNNLFLDSAEFAVLKERVESVFAQNSKISIPEVVLITDQNYFKHTITAACSILRHTLCRINIICYQVDNSIKSNQIFLNKFKCFNFIFIEDCSVYRNIQMLFNNIGEHLYVTKTSCIKFFIPEILINADKVIYIDTDVICESDFSELWEINLEDNLAAVAQDLAVINDRSLNSINVDFYFNSGMMLLNLSKMRQEHTALALVEAKKRINDCRFSDQDAFNVVFNNRFIKLPIKYNVMLYNYIYLNLSIDDLCELTGLSKKHVIEQISNPVFLHLTNVFKPWNELAFLSGKWKLEELFVERILNNN